MKNLIRRWLGISSQLELELQLEISSLRSERDSVVSALISNQSAMDDLRSTMEILYSELDTSIRQNEQQIRKIKPVLKVQDPEAVKFIKDILSKHDVNINTQQQFLEAKKLELMKLESELNNSTYVLRQAVDKVNILMSMIGLEKDTSVEDIRKKLSKIIQQAEVLGVEKVN